MYSSRSSIIHQSHLAACSEFCSGIFLIKLNRAHYDQSHVLDHLRTLEWWRYLTNQISTIRNPVSERARHLNMDWSSKMHFQENLRTSASILTGAVKMWSLALRNDRASSRVTSEGVTIFDYQNCRGRPARVEPGVNSRTRELSTLNFKNEMILFRRC